MTEYGFVSEGSLTAPIRSVPPAPAIEVEFDVEETIGWVDTVGREVMHSPDRVIDLLSKRKALSHPDYYEHLASFGEDAHNSLVKCLHTGHVGRLDDTLDWLAYNTYGEEILYFSHSAKQVKVTMNYVYGMCFGAVTCPRREVLNTMYGQRHPYVDHVLGQTVSDRFVKAHRRGVKCITPPAVIYLEFDEKVRSGKV